MAGEKDELSKTPTLGAGKMCEALGKPSELCASVSPTAKQDTAVSAKLPS